jgi:polar amino acid transport system substrate-binding protein
MNDKGELAGFDVDIARALCRVLRVRCELLAVPWGEILDGLVKNKYQMVVASMAKTPERDRLVDFSDSYYRSRSAFVARETLSGTALPDALRGKVLVTQKGTEQARYLTDNYADIADVLLTEDMNAAYDALVAGRADAILSDSLQLYGFLTGPRGRGFDFVGEALPAADDTSSSHIAVREGDEELLVRINNALREIRLNGEYDAINRSYFPFSVY